MSLTSIAEQSLQVVTRYWIFTLKNIEFTGSADRIRLLLMALKKRVSPTLSNNYYYINNKQQIFVAGSWKPHKHLIYITLYLWKLLDIGTYEYYIIHIILYEIRCTSVCIFIFTKITGTNLKKCCIEIQVGPRKVSVSSDCKKLNVISLFNIQQAHPNIRTNYNTL